MKGRKRKSSRHKVTGILTPVYYYIDINCLEEDSDDEKLIMEMYSKLENLCISRTYTRNLKTTFYGKKKSKLIGQIIESCGVRVGEMYSGNVYLFKERSYNWSIQI